MIWKLLILASCLVHVAVNGKERCKRITVLSHNFQPNEIQVKSMKDLYIKSVIREFGTTACVNDTNFGVKDSNVIWVDKGCGAKFTACWVKAPEDPSTKRLKKIYGGNDANAIISQLQTDKANKYSNGCVCKVSGSGNFFGFDGSLIYFTGSCEYKIAQSVGSHGECSFMVSVQAEERDDGSTFYGRVNIQIFGKTFSLIRGNRLIIDEKEYYGYQELESKYQIYQSSSWLQTFRSDLCGLEVSYKEGGFIQVFASNRYTGHMKGLCGNCNGFPEDDYRLSDGSAPSTVSIGHSYTVTPLKYGLPQNCLDPSSVMSTLACASVHQGTKAGNACSLINDENGPFKDCIPQIADTAYQFYSMCYSEVCNAFQLGSDSNRAACDIFAAFAETCAQKGFIVDWRGTAGCQPDCPANSEFSNFVPAIQPSCTMRRAKDMPEWVLREPSEGCLCDKNYLLDKNGCIKRRGCGCRRDNSFMPVGVSFVSRNCLTIVTCGLNDKGRAEKFVTSGTECGGESHCDLVDGQRTCVCKKGFKWAEDGLSCVKDPVTFGQMLAERKLQRENRVKRQKTTCTCKVFGDPHIRTHDNQYIHFQGGCTYLLSSTPTQGGDCDYKVIGKFEPRGESEEEASFVRDVYIQTRGITIALLAGGILKIDGARRFVPVNLPDLNIQIVQNGRYMEVVTGCGVQISFDGKFTAIIETPKELGGELHGICGDCDGTKDDFRLANGTDVTHEENKHRDIGNSYAVLNPSGIREPAHCVQEDPDLECTAEMQAEARENSNCGRLTDTSGPFSDCLAALGSEMFTEEVIPLRESCEIDFCTYHNDKTQLEAILCGANEAMAAICETVGVGVQWRQEDFCPLTCPEDSTYSPLMPGCQPTCVDPEPNILECTLPDREGCQCNDGFVLDNGKCIYREDCGCRDEDLGYLPRGTTFLSQDCTQQYECQGTPMGSVLTTTPVEHGSCSEHATCEVNDDNQPTCVCLDGYTGDGYSCEEIPEPDPLAPPVVPPPPKDDDCVCVGSGDPHVDYFDGGRLQVFDPCKYTLAASASFVGECDFRVEIKNEIHPRHVTRSFIRLVDVKFPDGTTIRIGQDDTVFVNGIVTPIATSTSITVPNAIITREEGIVEVATGCGLRVDFDGKQKVNVRVPREPVLQLVGLCGNCNGDKWDDRMVDGVFPRYFPDGKIAAYKELARRYLVHDDSDMPDLSPICTPAPSSTIGAP